VITAHIQHAQQASSKSNLYIDHLVVKVSHEGQGIGTALLKRCEGIASLLGLQEVKLYPLKQTNVEAFYLRLGYISYFDGYLLKPVA
jgi:GNAT superfamily N-acetyltransferase